MQGRLVVDASNPVRCETLAAEHFRDLRIREAMDLYERALELNPKSVRAHEGLGACYLHLRDHTEALSHFERALDLEPDQGRALYGAATCHLELGHHEEAASYARKQTRLADRENRARGLYVLGLVARANGAWQEAADLLEESLKIHPHRRSRSGGPGGFELRHRYELALCYRELNQPERALVHIEWANRHGKHSRAVVFDLANLYLEVRRLEDAEKAFRILLKHNPEDRGAHIGIGRIFLEKKEFELATRSFATVLSKAGDDLDALSGMAEAHKGLGDIDRAAGYLEQIQRLYKLPRAQIERRLRALEMERQRRDAELLRVRNIAALNLMATGIAHELRQPLTVIRLAAQNARRDLASGNVAVLDEDLADVDAGVAKLDKIISILRDAASDEMRIDEVVSVRDAVESALLLFRAQLANRNIDVSIQITDGTYVVGSRVALQQILINLISNARDALTDSPDKRVEIRASEAADRVEIEVADSGCGMSQSVRDQALDPFFTTKQNSGTGLGLYICHNLARRMKGSFRIKETSVGRGTTFELTLPRAKEESIHG